MRPDDLLPLALLLLAVNRSIKTGHDAVARIHLLLLRQIVLTGEGRNFCAGIDTASLKIFADFGKEGCPARGREQLLHHIKQYQDTITSVERCRWPVIAAVHGMPPSNHLQMTQTKQLLRFIYPLVLPFALLSCLDALIQ